jgi:imidazole glycerol phosphate synthase subunit HisF
MNVDKNDAMPSGYNVYIDGGRTATGADTIEWANEIDSKRPRLMPAIVSFNDPF